MGMEKGKLLSVIMERGLNLKVSTSGQHMIVTSEIIYILKNLCLRPNLFDCGFWAGPQPVLFPSCLVKDLIVRWLVMPSS